MITQLLTSLQSAEKIAAAVVKDAEAAYNAAVKARASIEETAALDPGRHQVALGMIRTAIEHIQPLIEASTSSGAPAAANKIEAPVVSKVEP